MEPASDEHGRRYAQRSGKLVSIHNIWIRYGRGRYCSRNEMWRLQQCCTMGVTEEWSLTVTVVTLGILIMNNIFLPGSNGSNDSVSFSKYSMPRQSYFILAISARHLCECHSESVI